MQTNLPLYHRVLKQLEQWWPTERVTRQRNMALLVTGLYLSRAVQMALIVRTWPSRSKEASLVNWLRRFLNNPRVEVRHWYRPLAMELVQMVAGSSCEHPIRLVIDCTKVGFDFRLMTISVAYRRRTLPLVWSVHRGRKGHTTAEEQLALLRDVRQLIPRQCEVWVLGDTGFQTVPILQ